MQGEDTQFQPSCIICMHADFNQHTCNTHIPHSYKHTERKRLQFSKYKYSEINAESHVENYRILMKETNGDLKVVRRLGVYRLKNSIVRY